MEVDFEFELKGSSIQANAAKEQIAKYFKRYGDSGHPEANKHQLIFASKIMCAITKCENKHLGIYCNIIVNIFDHGLCPEASAKYWTLYVNCIRYIHYFLVEKKEFEKASLIYRHISSYKNKLQNTENSLSFINIYCYQLFLQNSLKSKNQELALHEATDVVENLIVLFNEILDTNKILNFHYPNVLQKTISWLFPQNGVGTVYKFLSILPQQKIKQMFQALFTLYGQQTIDIKSNDVEIQEYAKSLIEVIYTLLQVDIMDKMRLQLSVELLSHCQTDYRLKANKPIAELFVFLYEYLKILCDQKPTSDFQRLYSERCENFKIYFEKYSKNTMNQAWFGDFLILVFYLHSQLQNLSIFPCFWKQMDKIDCFKSVLQFFVDIMKLAPCISAETKLFTINCCTSVRKHVILSFAHIALAFFVFYCQNVKPEDEMQQEQRNHNDELTDYYKETIQNNLILIINHAFKIIEKMDCITSSSPEIEIMLTRFKQVTLSCKTYKQAGTCIPICELFPKIKTKIAGKEWPLLLRRLYKTVSNLITDDPNIGREIQMCYIASMLQDSVIHIDLNRIRTEISIFYATEMTTKTNEQQQQDEHCLLYLYHTTNLFVKPHLEPSRKKLLHWLESQHILKYYKTNTALLHSILKYSQSQYDFVVITKQAKLQTYAMAKISSLYKTLKSKDKTLHTLSRLEHLALGHVCVLLLNDVNAVQKFQIDSKDLSEEQLENLFMREEMSAITIHNDLKRFKLAWEAFKAFKKFYEKFDSEIITMDDAIIDWESILDDLGSLALFLQLSGYMEHSSEVWLLHYKCSRLLQDDFSALRSLSFFCEYSEQFEKNSNTFFKLEEEIQYYFPAIIRSLENLCNLQRQAHQSYVLLVVLQIAYYYARSSRFSFAQMLLQYVEQKHGELSQRQGRYDIVLATMDVIKFRLLWKNFDNSKAKERRPSRTTAENLILNRCLLHEVEETLQRFHDISYISSCDGVLYSILIINLVQELAECTANRLCDNFINALFIATSKCALLLGLALRFVQVMSMWMWVNLQMEYIDKAQVKLKIIKYVMGMKSLKEMTENYAKSLNDIQSSKHLKTVSSELLTVNPGMEAIRKLVHVQLSPIKTNKLQLSPSHQNSDLKHYYKCNIDTKLLPQNEQIEWLFFMVGCLNARLYFLVEDFEQLEIFYERGSKWMQMRENCFNKKYYKNVQLMAMQHYSNFLRARQQYDKAVKCLEYGIELCENNKFYIDAVYSINFQLQLMAAQKEISLRKNDQFKLPIHSRPRRVLQFNISPESRQQQTPAKTERKEKMSQNVIASGKKPSTIIKPLPTYATDSGCSSSKKVKTQAIVCLSSASSSSSVNSSTSSSTKPKPKFKICEDYLEVVEIIENVNNRNIVEDATQIKRTKLIDENEKLYKTPKVIRKTAKLSKTTGKKSSIKSKRPEIIPQFHIDMDLSDSPPSSMKCSLESRETKENLDTNELIAKMKNLEIKSSKLTKPLPKEIETKNTKTRHRSNPSNKSDNSIIVLEDSPSTVKTNELKIINVSPSIRNNTKTIEKFPNSQLNNDDNITSSIRSRRQRKLILDNKDEQSLQSKQPSIFTSTSTPIVTRSRKKNLI